MGTKVPFLARRFVMAVVALVLAAARATAPAEEAAPAGYVNFSFDQVDVPSFAKLVGDITGRKFVVADDVSGKKITVVSPSVAHRDVYPLFVSILESAGCSVIEDKDICRVVALPDRASPSAPVVGPTETTPEQGVVTKVIRLENVSAAELLKALEPRVRGGKAGAIAAVEETNHLVITDTAESVRRIEKIIAEIDQPGLSRATEVVPLQFVGAEELANQLTLAMQDSETRGEELRRRLPGVGTSRTTQRREPLVVASPESNSLILVGAASQISLLKRIIEQMDVDRRTGRGRLNAIFLKYISADEAAKSISSLLTQSLEKDAGPTRRRIAIEASTANNALLVDAAISDFEVVKQLVDQLDTPRQQVHIEVLIAEVSRTDELRLGVELASVEMPSSVGSTVVQGSSRLSETADSLMNTVQQGLFPGGITVGAAFGTRVDADGRVVASYPALINIDAVKKDSRFKVLSETALEAQNNREATVSIVNEIPILKSTIEAGAGTARDVIQNIERVDVGIKLKITPQAIPDGRVQLTLNPSIEAVIDPGPADVPFTPTIARREVSTTVAVDDGKTIVIAGLTREDKNRIEKRIPLLGSIPIIGWLFRSKIDSVNNTDVLIFVTPHIVGDAATADRLAEKWKTKTGLFSDEDE